MKILTKTQMASLDHQAIHDFGIPGLILMENAGMAVFQVILKKLEIMPDSSIASPILILTGKGNNGGDGYVVGRKLIEAGYTVKLFSSCPIDELKNDALTQAKVFQHFGEIILLKDAGFEEFIRRIQQQSVLVDALFGIGLSKNIEGVCKNIIETLQKYRKYLTVIAIDIPSGICANTGNVLGCAIKADDTVTFTAPKPGHFLNSGVEYTGNLSVVNISIPKSLIDTACSPYSLITGDSIRKNFPRRYAESHKGTYGKVLTIAGSKTMPGASILSAMSALKIGAGLSYLYTIPGNIPELAARYPEVIFYEAIESSFGTIRSIKPCLATGMDVIAIGPGLTRDPSIQDLLEQTLNMAQEHSLPLIIDADGIYAVSTLHLEKFYRSTIVLTPHPAEFAKLINKTPSDIKENRLHYAEEFSRRYPVILVLKGNKTIIAYQGTLYINSTGNSSLATGGTGDVLTGIIAGLIAQGLPPLEASQTGVYLHGLAGELASMELTEYAVTATDVIKYIPQALKITV